MTVIALDVGGTRIKAGEPYFGPLRAALAERLTFRTAPEIVPAELGRLGAALLAQDLPTQDLRRALLRGEAG